MQNAAHKGAAPELLTGDFDNRLDNGSTPRAAKHRPAKPVYQLTIQLPSEEGAIRLLRAALKALLRRFGLRCLRIEHVTSSGERP